MRPLVTTSTRFQISVSALALLIVPFSASDRSVNNDFGTFLLPFLTKKAPSALDGDALGDELKCKRVTWGWGVGVKECRGRRWWSMVESYRADGGRFGRRRLIEKRKAGGRGREVLGAGAGKFKTATGQQGVEGWIRPGSGLLLGARWGAMGPWGVQVRQVGERAVAALAGHECELDL